MHIFVNIRPTNKSMFIEYPSPVRGDRFLDYDKDSEAGDILIWLGRLHIVVSSGYG